MAQQKQNSREIDSFQIQINDSLQRCVEITTRLDERIQVLFDNQDEACEDIKYIKEKLHELDIKASNLSLKVETHSDKWSKLIDWTFKLIVTGISIFAAWKL